MLIPKLHSCKEEFKFTFCCGAGAAQNLKWSGDCATEDVKHNLQHFSGVEVMQ